MRQPEDIDKLLAELTLEEKCSLTAGRGLWSTAAVGRVGIPSVRVTDGPNGARGPILPAEGTLTSACIPCGSALGATWDPALVERAGALLGDEARSKACRVLLAPTVNIHRSPLAGRNFECYSEDPLLSGRTAAAFVRGAQSRGVACTVKHFAGNDAEFERNTISSEIDERTLREIYLTPFELAVKEGGALGVMTAYNRLNGTFCAEHVPLIRDILRGEWCFPGFVISDWGAVGSSAGSARAGLDLEMPGPGRFYGSRLVEAVHAGEVAEADVDACVRRLLTVLDGTGALDDPPEEPRSVDRPEDRTVAREVAAAAAVLLTNDGVLPLDPSSLRRLAVIGPNAHPGSLMGGGSANFRPHHRVSPLEALRARLGPGVEVAYEPGCQVEGPAPPLFAHLDVEVFGGHGFEGPPVHHMTVPDSRVLFFRRVPGVDAGPFSMRARGRFTTEATGPHTFTLVQLCPSRLLIDGAVVIDAVASPPAPGSAFFGLGSAEVSAVVDLAPGPHDVAVECTGPEARRPAGVTVGCRALLAGDAPGRAVALARASDLALVIVGTNSDWESEGRDRPHMDLPGGQDELIQRVVEANPNTVVVLNTGAPVAMDWAALPRAVLQCWFGGQEMAEALVDVLVGEADPGGRLPTTFPLRLEHNPSYGNFPGENGAVRYGEGVLVGYRWYEARRLPVRFPFGHGLSYSSFELGPPRLSAGEIPAGEELVVTVPVTNVGTRPGSEVVQCYVTPPPGPHLRPPQELRDYAKVTLGPGEATEVVLRLGSRAFARWDPANPALPHLEDRLGRFPLITLPRHPRTSGWVIDAGRYEVHIGRSSADIAHVLPVVVGPAWS